MIGQLTFIEKIIKFNFIHFYISFQNRLQKNYCFLAYKINHNYIQLNFNIVIKFQSSFKSKSSLTKIANYISFMKYVDSSKIHNINAFIFFYHKILKSRLISIKIIFFTCNRSYLFSYSVLIFQKWVIIFINHMISCGK